ncbi:MAG: YdcF family protein [Bacteroidota bacterium]
MSVQKSKRIFLNSIRAFVIASGVSFILIILLAFTTLPYWMYHRLGTYGEELSAQPEYVILLGGDGMPSETNLMRCATASEIAKSHPSAKLVIALPKDTGVAFAESSVGMMRKELLLRGIDSSRIILEPSGHNTREQAIRISGNIIPNSSSTLLVTSPEHMYRAIRTFRKAGMTNIAGKSAFSRPLESELSISTRKLGGRNLPAEELGGELQLRYQFWNHLRYQVLCYREYVAIAYYKLKGWI